ncbi:MAG TPA: asparagine synthase (glutamine-hydrolyzing) [Verrucomicrobiae bacterium]|nr:asparagine synthase (glutamine-hydrolyzing) [Verrucomicrobiae bacterium]
MCGFVGFWDRGGAKAETAILERMIAKIRYRGPDDQGAWVHGDLGLGHCRLSILDLSANGHQPFVTADGMGVLTYNGEVYNFAELRDELAREGIKFRSRTDTEVALYALHRWGPERAIPRFNGMFGFAYFDLRSRSLWIARDRSGIKPAYFSHRGNLIAFASEMKALFEHPGIPCRPDVHALGHFLTHQRFEGDWTPFEGVEQVTPGSYLKITQDSIKKTVYFDPIEALNIDKLLSCSRHPSAALLARFEILMTDAVKMQLVSDAPVATMCSGGIDSSLTTAIAHDFKPDVVGYVANVEGAVSEGDKAERVGRHLGMKIRRIHCSPEDLIRLWPEAVWHGDQPNCHANDMPYMMVTRACREDGIKVVLTGEGSDELFGGYKWQAQMYHLWKMRRLHAKFIKNNGFFRGLGKLHPSFKPLDVGMMMRYPFRFRSELEQPQNNVRYALTTDGGRSLLREELLFKKLERIPLWEERAFIARCLDDWYANLQAVLHRNDRISMAASIESRPPFLENNVLDFGLHAPCAIKYRNGSGKWVVKKMAEKKLPHDIVHAPKLHFPVNMNIWLRLAPLLDKGFVANAFKWSEKECRSIKDRASSMPQLVHNLVGIEIWGNLFMHGESSDDLGNRLIALGEIGAENIRCPALISPSMNRRFHSLVSL